MVAPYIRGLVLLLTAALFVGPAAAAHAAAEPDEPGPNTILADFTYANGVHAQFTLDVESGDLGLHQEGMLDRNGPIVRDTSGGLLAAYLTMTPATLPVPRDLLSELAYGFPTPSALAGRTVVPGPVRADRLAVPAGTSSSTHTCTQTNYAWYDWHDSAIPGMTPATYTTSMFGGKRRYTDSYVANCTVGEDYLWARHRIYYMNGLGNYKKQYELKVKPLHWDSQSEGSIKRWRRVIYDDAWNSNVHCGELTGHLCQYTREGRFND